MRIAFFSVQNFEKNIFDEANKKHKHSIQYIDHHLTPASKAIIPDTDVVCCFVNDKIDRSVIDVLKHKSVRLIALRSAGFNHVDCRYATENNIPVCRVPYYSPYAVAEHAVAMILSLNRKIHRAYNRIREGDFSLHGLLGFDLYGSTVGIIGTGNIGTVFAKIMIGFGCKVVAYDIKENENCLRVGVQYIGLDELLCNSDIISVHCPLNVDTKNIICQKNIDKMKTGVMLINTSRGQLLDTKAVIEGLKSKKIGYLGIDVYEEEEKLFFEDHSDEIIFDDLFCRLQTFPNVLITGHQAFFTRQAIQNIACTTLNNVTNFESGKGSVCYITDDKQ